jgi:hypothetical protein
VDVDLALNAHANARWHHELRKKHLGKLRKTLDANAKAFKAAERRTNTQLVQVTCSPHLSHNTGLDCEYESMVHSDQAVQKRRGPEDST